MSTALTIRHLDPRVKQKLRQQAASHHRSMEAEARELLAQGVGETVTASAGTTPQERMRKALADLGGLWSGQGSTDELMRELRGED